MLTETTKKILGMIGVAIFAFYAALAYIIAKNAVDVIEGRTSAIKIFNDFASNFADRSFQDKFVMISILVAPPFSAAIWIKSRTKYRSSPTVESNDAATAPRLLYYADPSNGHNGRGTTIILTNGEPCTVSLARNGVLIKQTRFMFGRTLYRETNPTRVAAIAVELHNRVAANPFPVRLVDPVLDAFARFIWNSDNCDDIKYTIEKISGQIITD